MSVERRYANLKHAHAAADILDLEAAIAAFGYVPTSRTISAGAGLTGGGDLSANRTLALDAASIASLGLADSAVQPGDLAAVAFSGDYADLTGTPSIPADTDDVPEGGNLYFTNERVDDRVAALLTAGTNITLTYNDGAGTLTIDASGSSASGANPTASVGLTAVNGSATTYLRSDGAPALSQAIAPTWTGTHTFTGLTPTTTAASYASVGNLVASSYPGFMFFTPTPAANTRRWGMYVDDPSGLFSLATFDDSGAYGTNLLSAARTTTQVTTITIGSSGSSLASAANASWTGTHVFSGAYPAFSVTGSWLGVGQTGGYPSLRFRAGGAASNQKNWELSADTSTGRLDLVCVNDAVSAVRAALGFARSGVALTAIDYGNATDAPPHTFYGNGNFTAAGNAGVTVTSTSTGLGFTMYSWGGNGFFISSAVRDIIGAFTNGSGVLTSMEYGNSTDSPPHTFYGRVDVTGGFRARSQYVPSGGAGLEVSYVAGSNLGYVLAYDRGASAYKGLTLAGSAIKVEASGSEVVTFNSATAVNGGISPGALSAATTSNGGSIASLLVNRWLPVTVGGTTYRIPLFL